MVIELPFLNIKKRGGSSNEKATGFYGSRPSGFFSILVCCLLHYSRRRHIRLRGIRGCKQRTLSGPSGD